MSETTFRRRLALALIAHAAKTLRGGFWADGMEQEIHHIPDDWQALTWSAGCVFAGYRESANPAVLLAWLFRLLLAAPILAFAYENLMGPAQAIGCYLHISQPALDFLASLPDDQVVCVSWSTLPPLIVALSFIAGGLFALSALILIRNGPGTLRCFALAFAAGLAAFVFEQGIPALDAYRHSPLFSQVLVHVMIGRLFVPILVAAALWLIPRDAKNNAANARI